ncbi:MAG: hypothetical protein F4W90_06505 [Gammaproteobacteria bacterium]|nr:hypothetical protein [Gammaproteobacteria bacterium]
MVHVRHIKKPPGLRALVTAFVLMPMAIAAEPQGIYYGASATMQQAEIEYKKSVRSLFRDNEGRTDTQETSANVEEKPLQWDGLLGYRLNFAEGTQFFAIQLEASLLGDDVSGRLGGEGESASQNLFGEAWPEDWSLETSRTLGVVTKYGISRALLQAIDISLYGLVGVRQTTIDFFSSSFGCFQAIGCDVNEFRTNTQSLDPEVNLVVAGVGIETGLTNKAALQFEVRYVQDFKSEWLTEFEDSGQEVSVPSGLTIESTDLTVKLIRYL